MLSDGESRFLIISFDFDKGPSPKEWMDKIVERANIPLGNILYIGTHTHSAPITTFRPKELSAKQSEC